MADRKERLAEYRRQAKYCLELAKQMSLQDDRDTLMEMAKRWLSLADEMEAEEE